MAMCNWGANWSRGKWWLWALLGLLALYLLMLWSKWRPIEQDIQTRTNAALSAQGHSWAGAALHDNGRDVMLAGTAPSESAQQAAIEIARGVEGVRVVNSSFDLKQYRAPHMALATDSGGVVLRGELATQAAVDQAVSAANAVYGADRVRSELTVPDDIAEASWMGALPSALSGMKSVGNPGLDIAADGGVVLRGVVRSDDEKVSTYNMVNAALGGNIDNQLTVKPLSPAMVEAARDGQGIALRGTVGSQSMVDNLVGAAGKVVGAGNVSNQLTISDDTADPAWGGAFGQALGAIPAPGGLSMGDNGLKLTGEMPDAAAKTSLLNRAKGWFAGVNIVDGLTVKPKPKPVPKPVVKKVEPPKPSAAEVCQTRLNEAMAGKKINFAVNSADITDDSIPLLRTIITVVKDCNTQLQGTTIEVSGHTDSTGALAYNEYLSTERANSVLRYLVNAGVNGDRLTAAGYGPHRPVASNDTKEGRAQNRRIQFEIKQ